MPPVDRNDGQRFALPRWLWRSAAVATAVALLLTGEGIAATGAVVAFAVAEVVFDAAELERD